MRKEVQLKTVPVGATFEVWGQRFTVLDYNDNGVFCLAADLTGDEVSFRSKEDKFTVAPNDFRDSTIKQYLNETYLEHLKEAGAEIGDIAETAVDLKCTMGQHEYGAYTVLVGLLTLEQYGMYYDIIPPIHDWWWLATPWTTPSRSQGTFTTTQSWYIHDDIIARCSCFGSYGVRPTLTLCPLLLVSLESEDEDNGCLGQYSTKELLAELARRAGED